MSTKVLRSAAFALVLLCLSSWRHNSLRELQAADKPPESSETCPGLHRPVPPAVAFSPKAGTLWEKRAAELAVPHGLTVEQEKDKLAFRLLAGKEITLFRVDATDDGLVQAEKQISQLVAAKMLHLSATFGVSFSAAGEVVDKQWVKDDKDEWVRGNDVKARLPRLHELYGIEAALYRAQPSYKAKDGSSTLKFYFLTDDLTKGERPLATYVSNRNGRPAIHFYPGSTAGRLALERDLPFEPDRPMGHAYGSIEALTMHEISHNHQHVIGWWTGVEKTAADQIGFVSLGSGWAIKGKAKDKTDQHVLYRKNEKTGMWYRCDSNGDALSGEPELTGRQMRQEALHKPMTYYFPSPSETYAEGVMVFRLGGVYRAQLLKENPALYAVAKKLDQQEIDQVYGLENYLDWERGYDQWGREVWYQVVRQRSSYIRGSDGYLTGNTAGARVAVEIYERAARRSDSK